MTTFIAEFAVSVRDGIKEIIKYTWWTHVFKFFAVSLGDVKTSEGKIYTQFPPVIYFIIGCFLISLAFNILLFGGSVILVGTIIYGYIILFKKIRCYNNLTPDSKCEY